MKYVTLLPFMDSEELSELAHKILNNEVKGVNIVTLYPFLDSELLDVIVDKMIELGETKKLTSILPFVSSKKINDIYQAIKSGTLKDVKEVYLLPFLDKATLKEMFYDLVKKAGEESSEDTDDEFDNVMDIEDEE